MRNSSFSYFLSLFLVRWKFSAGIPARKRTSSHRKSEANSISTLLPPFNLSKISSDSARPVTATVWLFPCFSSCFFVLFFHFSYLLLNFCFVFSFLLFCASKCFKSHLGTISSISIYLPPFASLMLKYPARTFTALSCFISASVSMLDLASSRCIASSFVHLHSQFVFRR